MSIATVDLDPPGEPSSHSAVAGIVISCLAGVALLVVLAIFLYKWAFQAVTMRRTINGPLGTEDQSGSGAAQETRQTLRLI